MYTIYFAHGFVFSLLTLTLKPDSHMSPTIGELLSVTVDPENSQKILCIDSCEQSLSIYSCELLSQSRYIQRCHSAKKP